MQVSYARSWSGYTSWRGKHSEEPDPLQQYQQKLLDAYGTKSTADAIQVQYQTRLFLCTTHSGPR